MWETLESSSQKPEGGEMNSADGVRNVTKLHMVCTAKISMQLGYLKFDLYSKLISMLSTLFMVLGS